MNSGTMSPTGFFAPGERISLRSLGGADATSEYLSWLNDAEVLRYRGPKGFPTTLTALRQWIETLPDRGDLVLAVCENGSGRHVGNVSLNTIQWIHPDVLI